MARCECSDAGCKGHVGHSECRHEAAITLYRVDMADLTGTLFCAECANDAMDSGVFCTRDEGGYHDCGEGPWDTEADAIDFAEAEVGVEWVVAEKDGQWRVMVK